MAKLSPEEIAEKRANEERFAQEKEAARQEAYNRTEWEHRRLESYKSLRYNFQSTSVLYWIDKSFEEQAKKYEPIKNPSRNEIRKTAGVGFFENIPLFKSDEQKKDIETKKNQAKKELQAKVDKENEKRKKECDEYNKKLNVALNSKYHRFLAYDENEISEYFCYVLRQDSYGFDGNVFQIDFCLK